jgi:hypothetical protein
MPETECRKEAGILWILTALQDFTLKKGTKYQLIALVARHMTQ